MGRSKASKTKQDKDSTMSSPTCPVQLELQLFATVESVPQSKETISIDKSPICNPCIQMPDSSKTSEAGSTLKEKDCVPYWTDFYREISSRLLLPVGTDCADLDSSLYNTWSSKTVDKSWFSNNLYIAQVPNLQPIYSAFSMFSLAECMDSESTVKKSRKIKIFLNPIQKAIVKKWFGMSRFVYSKAIEYLQEPNTKANWYQVKKSIFSNLPEWCKEAPYQIKSIAVKDA